MRRLLWCCALALPLACSGKTKQQPVAADEAGAARGDAGPGAMAVAPAKPMRKIQFRGSVEGFDDMLTFVEEVVSKAEPEDRTDVRAEMQASFLQQGYKPGFYESLDLGGLFAIDLGYPFPEVGEPAARPSDLDLAGVIPSTDPKRMLDSMPDTLKPQPLGDGLWELIMEDNLSLKLRQKDKFVEFGGEIADLDRAGQLPGQLGPGRRVRARVSDLPAEWLDLSRMLGGVPGPAQAFAEVVRETKAVEFAGDAGTDRDVVAVVAAEAPFAKLGLGPLGKASAKPSPLAASLPPNAAFALEMPWGDPKLLHEIIDNNVDPGQVPAPFDAVVVDAVKASHGLLDQLRDGVLAAWYVDKAGRVSIVMAGAVADDATARDSIRTLLGSAEKAFSAHISLQGNEKDKKYSVAIKKDVKMSRAKVDRFTVTVPKFLQGDFESLAMLVGKKNPKLEIYVTVHEGMAIMAMGAGAKKTMGDMARSLGKPRPKSLEAEGGLALARSIDGGCQFCVMLDPVEATRMYFVAKRDSGSNDKAAGALKKLDKLKISGEFAFSVKLEDTRGSVGVAMPRLMIAQNPKDGLELNELILEVSAADQSPSAWDALTPMATFR